MRIDPLADSDRPWLREDLVRAWGSTRVVSRGRLHPADLLPGLVARQDGAPAGYLLHDGAASEREVVVLHALLPRRGIGRAMLDAAAVRAWADGCRRLWLTTTNDNTPAISFYRAVGWRLLAVHRGAVRESRLLKPEIPLLGIDGVPIEDEWEFELSRG